MVARMLSTVEVAELEGLSRLMVARMAGAGCFPGAYKTGAAADGRWRIPEDGLEAYRQAQREASQQVSSHGFGARRDGRQSDLSKALRWR